MLSELNAQQDIFGNHEQLVLKSFCSVFVIILQWEKVANWLLLVVTELTEDSILNLVFGLLL